MKAPRSNTYCISEDSMQVTVSDNGSNVLCYVIVPFVDQAMVQQIDYRMRAVLDTFSHETYRTMCAKRRGRLDSCDALERC
jgi:hypothetical protein